ncbi:MAG: bifunctional diaminohydroxyphosphoribosylaminopyrimidine deaminase/5-amino-6-(5-phosphoribosylamino)uracil reductase RibD [Oligoflexia bacterium]|nr:bifunctional diaminohydroxyphosphoribosylaminopyrimidine deaminase/5-amino-6-(5-phosphoribosylamino)uracil reductase RibD [Oligoflexia bacterium]
MQSLEVSMNQAILAACRARGQTAPNPMVGAVIISRSGEFISEGWHRQAGKNHAEVEAIQNALSQGADLAGSTLVVTLEPCNHTGKTGPCTQAILKSGISRVVIGCEDPNPLMRGKSILMLRQSGLDVTCGVAEAECQKLIRGFKSVLENKRPFVTLKAATSLDGKIATGSGESQWITGPDARVIVHQERSSHDAVLVGVGTILTDDPHLTVRMADDEVAPTKVVLDSRLLTPPNARIFQNKSKVFIYCDRSYPSERRLALEAKGAIVRPMSGEDGKLTPGFIDLKSVLEDLASLGVQELLVEGNARVLGAFVRRRLFDRLLYFISPKILGSSSKDVFEGVDTLSLNESLKLSEIQTRSLGQDILVEGRL